VFETDIRFQLSVILEGVAEDNLYGGAPEKPTHVEG